MSSVFKNDMARNLEDDAALTQQRPRQTLQDRRMPDEVVRMGGKDNNDLMLDGILEALKRRT